MNEKWKVNGNLSPVFISEECVTTSTQAWNVLWHLVWTTSCFHFQVGNWKCRNCPIKRVGEWNSRSCSSATAAGCQAALVRPAVFLYLIHFSWGIFMKNETVRLCLQWYEANGGTIQQEPADERAAEDSHRQHQDPGKQVGIPSTDPYCAALTVIWWRRPGRIIY